MNPASLIHAALDGDITPEQHAKLEALLRDDWRVRRLYLELADQDARLFRQPVVNSGRLRPSPVIGRTARWRTAALVAAAAAMVLPAFIVWPRSAVEKEASSDGVAMVSDTVDAEFADTAVRSGDAIAPGKLTLKKGLAQIEFFSGATVLIEGATHIEVISAWEARCLAGRVRVQVPPAAKGFLMHAPEVMLEDLGTEFALNVTGQDSAVHVFAGEVIAHTKEQAPESLKAGMSLASAKADVSPRDFLPISDLKGLIRQRKQRRFEHWQTWSEGVREDPRLIAYYTFQHTPGDRWDRLVSNLADPLQKQRAGGAVGARWTQGRWPGKEALEFKRPGDRLRLNLDGTYTALTLSAWVKVDSVDKKYNSLLLTDGYDNGEPHWQIYEDGSLMFSIIYRPEGVTRGGDWNQTYYSKPVFSADSLGRWHHIAVSYSHHSGEVIQYFDGAEVGREVSTRHRPGLPITFGPCEIGNWGLPTERHPAPIRNLNGVIDEFAIYGSVLSGAEVQAIFANGRPE
jgi:hypothetical protein